VAAPVLPKASVKADVTPKTSPAAKDAPAKAGEPAPVAPVDTQANTASTTPVVPVNAAQPAEIASQHGAQHAAAEALKSDAIAGASAASSGAAHGHAASTETVQAPVNPQTNGMPTLTNVQPQLQPAATPATPQLTVIAATQAAAVPLSGVAMEIAASVRSGMSRFEIRLDPADLGRIDVRIDINRHGQVTSHLTVEKPETLQMLRQDSNQLHRALNDAGLSTNSGGLQFSLRDQSQSGQNNQNQSTPHAQRLIVSEEEVIPAAVASYGRMFGPSGGVDISV
jgi:flagellar hook-length control protein FliK